MDKQQQADAVSGLRHDRPLQAFLVHLPTLLTSPSQTAFGISMLYVPVCQHCRPVHTSL